MANAIDVGDEIVRAGEVLGCLDLQIAVRLPDANTVILAEAGEESSYQFGIDFMVERHWDKIAAEFSIAEGGHMVNQGAKVTQVVRANGRR